MKPKLQFEDNHINRWKKFLLMINPNTAKEYLNHWLSYQNKSVNMIALTEFLKGYLQDLTLRSQNVSVPAEYNLQNYRNVMVNI